MSGHINILITDRNKLMTRQLVSTIDQYLVEAVAGWSTSERNDNHNVDDLSRHRRYNHLYDRDKIKEIRKELGITRQINELFTEIRNGSLSVAYPTITEDSLTLLGKEYLSLTAIYQPNPQIDNNFPIQNIIHFVIRSQKMILTN